MRQNGGIILPYKENNNVASGEPSIDKNKRLVFEYLANSDITKIAMGSYGLTLGTNLVYKTLPDSAWTIKKSKSTGMRYYSNKLTKENTYNVPEEIYNNPACMPVSETFKMMVPNKFYGHPVSNLLIKLCLIHDDEDLKISDIFSQNLHMVNENDFKNEINIQTNIFMKTMNYLQPLCPAIVSSAILNDPTDINNLLVVMNMGADINLQRQLIKISFFLRTQPDVKLGIIAMEIVGNGQTLSEIEDHFLKMRDRHMIDILLNVGRYAILKLALDTEYNHNDFHKHNILCLQSNAYFDSPQFNMHPVIIDFGRTAKIPPEIMKKIRDAVASQNYTLALSYLCDKSYAFEPISEIGYAQSHYGWICGDYNMTDEAYEEYAANLLNETNQKIEAYNANPAIIRKQPLITIADVKKRVQKPLKLDDEVNGFLSDLFKAREGAIDKVTATMLELHNSQPDKYPLLPLSNQMKNVVYNGLIGGKRRNRRYNRTYKRNNKKSKYNKRHNRKTRGKRSNR